MERDSIKHSAEGTHWQKKNHKYIRKEGNRYIYPSDLKKLENTANARREAVNNQNTPDYKKLSQQKANRSAAASGKVVNPGYVIKGSDGAVIGRGQVKGAYASPTTADYKKAGQLRGGESNRYKNVSKQGSQDYKKLSQQKANRSAAASGKVVNPTYNMKDETGKTIFRFHSNDKVSMPTTTDYKKAGQLRGGESKRYNTVSNQGSTDYKDLSKKQTQKTNRANAANGARGAFEKGHMSDQDYQKKYYERQVVANRRKRAAGSGQNKGQTYAKNTAHEGKFRAERLLADKEQRRKKRVNEAVMELTAENAKNSEINKMVKTPKDYENTFRSKVAKKKVNRGRQIVDKILSKFRKKK